MPIDMPVSPAFVDSDFSIESNSQIFESPLTKNVQRLALSGSRFTFSGTLPKMTKRQAAFWKAFFLSCEGQANTFNAYDPDMLEPLGRPTGNPVVAGAGQSGSTLSISGCTSNVIGWLMPGDPVSFGGEYKQMTERIDTDSSGNATLRFKPAIRTSPASGSTITVYKPTCTMILADDAQAKWPCDRNGIYAEKSFTAFEVW